MRSWVLLLREFCYSADRSGGASCDVHVVIQAADMGFGIRYCAVLVVFIGNVGSKY